MLLADYATRMAVKNHIVVDTIQQGNPFDPSRHTAQAAEMLRELADEQDQAAARAAGARSSRWPGLGGDAMHPHDYRDVDVANLRLPRGRGHRARRGTARPRPTRSRSCSRSWSAPAQDAWHEVGAGDRGGARRVLGRRGAQGRTTRRSARPASSCSSGATSPSSRRSAAGTDRVSRAVPPAAPAAPTSRAHPAVAGRPFLGVRREAVEEHPRPHGTRRLTAERVDARSRRRVGRSASSSRSRNTSNQRVSREPSARNHISQSRRRWYGANCRGSRRTSPGLPLNSYSRQCAVGIVGVVARSPRRPPRSVPSSRCRTRRTR